MNIEISTSKLRGALAAVKSCSGGSTLPILHTVKLEAAGDGKLHLATTTLDMQASVALDAECTPGGVCVPIKTLAGIVDQLDAVKLLLIEVSTSREVKIISGESRYKLACGLPVEEFPKIDLPGEKFVTVNFDALRSALVELAPAMCTDESRWVLNSILFEITKEGLNLVASDGRRLVMDRIEFKADLFEKIVVPKLAVEAILKLKIEGDVRIAFDERVVALIWDAGSLVTKRIDNTYPNVRQVIPERFDRVANIDRVKFRDALKRVGAIDGDKVTLNFADGKCLIQTTSPNVGEGQETVEIGYSGDPLSIAFNPDYFGLPFQTQAADALRVEFQGDKDPAVITDGANYKCVVMPMRAN